MDDNYSEQSEFHSLLELQQKSVQEVAQINFSYGLRGLLCLINRSPALASDLFTHLWPQLWHRLLLRRTEPTTHPSVGSESTEPVEVTGHASMPAADTLAFVLPQLLRFLTSDQHVSQFEPQPSALGAFLSALATTTPDSLLVYLPLPAISYLGAAYNQCYTVSLFLESVCARTRALTDSSCSTDFIYNLSIPQSTTEQDNPLRSLGSLADCAALSLVAMYDSIADVDYFTAAWWYRLNTAPLLSITSPNPDQSMLKCLEYAQHGHTLRALEVALNLLLITGGATSSQDTTATTTTSTTPTSRTTTGPRPPSVPAMLPSNIASACTQFSEFVNRFRLHEYCVRYMKQLGQWDSLDSLASSTQSPSHFPSLGNIFGPVGFGTTGGSSVVGSGGGGSAFWGLKADAAWRRSDWAEVYSSLARLANECPRADLCRYALIQGAACVAGRRTTSFAGASSAAAASSMASSSGEVDPFGLGSTLTADSGPTPSSGGVQTSPGPSAQSNTSQTASSNSNSVIAMLQASEVESHRIMSTVLREWRRLPLIVTSHHVPLLQIAHRAAEVTEGNSLLAQYCGHMLGAATGPNVSSSSQATCSSSPVSTPSANTSTNASPGTSRAQLNQTPLLDYKTVFKSWQYRSPSIGDDLAFWHDLFSWRQVVAETVISCHPHTQKFSPDRTHLVALCERELAFSQLQLVRGARKHRFPSIAQQHLDRYARLNLPPLFEKSKQEIKLKMLDLRKDELLEGLELMEKTNIQQFEKKDRAKFFCYKALFFSLFNKGDEATKNFGYATQMQDNMHKVWSIYGDFLENVYSGYPATKREQAVSTTGVFAMQALMEAASISGGLERRSRTDIAKCLWLLSLDDTKSGHQRLARTFEERSPRVRSDAFLPWLPNLVVSCLRPEGPSVLPAIRTVASSHPTGLYELLQGLEHQLSCEARYDERINKISQTSDDTDSFAELLRTRIKDLTDNHQLLDTDARSRSAGRSTAGKTHDLSRRSDSASQMMQSHGKSGFVTQSSKSLHHSMNVPCNLLNTRKKKKVVVVMRGVECERFGEVTDPSSVDSYASGSDAVGKTAHRGPVEIAGETTTATTTVEEVVDDTDDGDLEPMDTVPESMDSEAPSLVPVVQPLTVPPSADGDSVCGDVELSESVVDDETDDHAYTTVVNGTGCLSRTVSESLHLVELLLNQLRRQHSARIYTMDLFTTEVAGRLQPSWSENLLSQLCWVLDYIHRLAWAALSTGRTYSSDALSKLSIPNWLADELGRIGAACGLPISSPLLENWQSDASALGRDKLTSLDSASPDKSDGSSDLEADESGRMKAKRSRRLFATYHPDRKDASFTAFERADILNANKLLLESQTDPLFGSVKSQLSEELANLKGKSLLFVMQQLTRRWIPLVEDRVNRLPCRTHLSDYGARRLMELPSLVISTVTNSSSLGGPDILDGPYLELPGESALLQSTGGGLTGSVQHGPTTSSNPSAANSSNPKIWSNLTIAEVLPHTRRIHGAAGRWSPAAHRIGIRASNGRLFQYDLIAPNHPVSPGATAAHVAASVGAATRELLAARGRTATLGQLTAEEMCPPAYTGWRHRSVNQLLQIVNDMLSSQPETAKRHLSLSIPRIMEIGPMGLCLAEAGGSAPAPNVCIASAHPLPSANPINAQGLTALGRPSPLSSATSTSATSTSAESHPQPVSNLDSGSTPAWALPLLCGSECQGIRSIDLEKHKCRRSLSLIPPPAPHPAFLTSSSSSSSSSSNTLTLTPGLAVGGSSAVAAEAIGRPSGMDAGCQAVCMTLHGIVDLAGVKSVSDQKPGATPTSRTERPRELICTYFERIAEAGSSDLSKDELLPSLFKQILGRVPAKWPSRHSLASPLALLDHETSDENEQSCSSDHIPRASLLRQWAANRMADAESFWLFRHSAASHLGLIGLTERLFHLIPLHPACLMMDPRTGQVEARHARFTLPPNVGPAGELAASSSQQPFGDKSSAHFAICFIQSMALGPLKALSTRPAGTTSKPPPGSLDSGDNLPSFWRIDPNPVPFRLTPQLVGFVCLPGAPPTVGPLAATLTTAAQALFNGQRSHSLASLYRTLLRSDYILWHRGRQAAVHAFQLVTSSDETRDLVEPSSRRKARLFDELGSTTHSGLSFKQQTQSNECCSLLVPDLTNEQLVQLVSLTVDSMNTSIKALSDYSGPEPNAWSYITAATNPSNLCQMSPDWLPWL